MLENYPTILIILGGIIVFLYIIKEIKDIFFSRDSSGITFGTNLKYFFFFWLKKEKRLERIKEPKNMSYTKEGREKMISKLFVHNFFQSTCNMKRNIEHMDFGSFEKNIVLRDIIKIYVETIEKYAKYFLENYNLDEFNTRKLNELLLHEIERAQSEIYSKMRYKLGNDLYNKLIEDPIRGFKTKNAIFKEIFINGVMLISSQAMSVYNYDNYERASEILTSMYISLQVIVKNFESVFKNYNGELDAYLNKK